MVCEAMCSTKQLALVILIGPSLALTTAAEVDQPQVVRNMQIPGDLRGGIPSRVLAYVVQFGQINQTELCLDRVKTLQLARLYNRSAVLHLFQYLPSILCNKI